MNEFLFGFILGVASLAAVQTLTLWRLSRTPKAPKVPSDYWLICPCMKDGHA